MRTGILELRLKADPRDVNEVLGLGEGGDAPAGGLLLLGGGISQRSVRPSSLAILQSLKKCIQADEAWSI